MPESSCKTLCLALLAKPNAQILDALLLNVKPFIDSWVICSKVLSDQDESRIRNTFAGVQGSFIQSSFADYGQTKNTLLRAAQSSANSVLMLDASEQLCLLNPCLDIPDDFEAAFIDIVRDKAITPELRLFSATADVAFDSPTGASISVGEGRVAHVDTCSIKGQAPHQVWINDPIVNRFLLDAVLGKFAANPGLSLTLAKIELAHGKLDIALEHLNAVLSCAAPDKISWMAHYLKGGICAAQRNLRRAVEHWQAAFELMPNRAEPLMRLAELHFEKEDYQTAALLADEIRNFKKPQLVDYYEPDAYGHKVDILKARAWHKSARSDDAIAHLNVRLTDQISTKTRDEIGTALEEIKREQLEKTKPAINKGTSEIGTQTLSSEPAPKLTIGMATHDDYDGVYFSVMSLLLYHKEYLENAEILIVDNNPMSKHGEAVRGLSKRVPGVRYIAAQEYRGTSIRELVFQQARGDYVLCMDCHVFLHDGVLARLIKYFDDNPTSKDILHGPIYYDNHDDFSTHMTSDWFGGFYGRWGTKQEGDEFDNPPFEIPMQGLGLFACVKSQWPGFNLKFRGFGGEEGYIHEKFRQRGGKALCLPFLRWTHRFDRPNAPTYVNSWQDRIRNYLIGWDELNLDTTPILKHFSELLGEANTSTMYSQFLLEKNGPLWAYDTVYLYSKVMFDSDILRGWGADRIIRKTSSKQELQDLLLRSIERKLPNVLLLISKTDNKHEFETAVYKSLAYLERLKTTSCEVQIIDSPVFQANLVSAEALQDVINCFSDLCLLDTEKLAQSSTSLSITDVKS
jgi:tetratricopeptide (TPR) repeat protein